MEKYIIVHKKISLNTKLDTNKVMGDSPKEL